MEAGPSRYQDSPQSGSARPVRRPVSCDVCRSRKVRCVKDVNDRACRGCSELGTQCTYTKRTAARKPYGRPFGDAAHIRSPHRGFESGLGPTAPPQLPQSPVISFQPARNDESLGFGNFFDPSAWLPDTLPGANAAIGGERAVAQSPSLPFSAQSTSSGPASSGAYGENIESILSWSTVLSFIHLYHERLYPRLPIVHWPRFSQELMSRKDRTDRSFRTFILSLTAYTMLQLPTSAIPEEHRSLDLPNLHGRCHRASRALRPLAYDTVTLDHVRASYCDYIYLRSSDRSPAADIVLAETLRLSTSFGCHESTLGRVEHTDFIEMEMRKRTFWLIYGSDRTTGSLTSRPMLIDDDDISAEHPLEVDDELITAAGCFTQPADRVPIVAGFVRVTKIFRVVSRALGLLRRAKRVDPSPEYTDKTRRRIQELEDELQAEMASLPEPLDIFKDRGAVSATSLVTDHAFGTCRANLLITHALARFELYKLAFLTGVYDHCLDPMTQTVLKRLDATPTDYLTANGSSMRHKVQYLASFLLGQEDQFESLGIPKEALSILAKTVRVAPVSSTRES